MSDALHDDNVNFLNRELSILHFNARVLAQALDVSIPLLERLRYVLICSKNLDEFFEIRVANLKLYADQGSHALTQDGYPCQAVLQKISDYAHTLVARQYTILNEAIFPELEQHGIHIIDRTDWTQEQAQWLKLYFIKQVLPLLSPIALDPAHPFPALINKSLNFVIALDGKDAFGRDYQLAIVHTPRKIPRFIRLPAHLCADKEGFVYLSSVIETHVNKLFPGMAVKGCYQFRLTRNSDFSLDLENVEDLPRALKNEIRSRSYGQAIRLEIHKDCPAVLYEFLLHRHQLSAEDLYRVDGQVNLGRSEALLNLVDHPELRYPTLRASVPNRLQQHKDIFANIRDKAMLLNHPFQDFAGLVDLVYHAAADPDVLAIKITLYRTGADSPMVDALVNAAFAGKEVTAVIELQARFDEADNIALAQRLQDAGALVVYGVLGYKTHAKMLLLVRREHEKLMRYTHLGTGNYHADTAKVYVDYGLLTADKEITHDVQSVFNQLTGMGKAFKLKKILHAPFTMADKIISLIKFEITQAQQGQPARIIAKMNALTEPKIIKLLYMASQAGVQIDLLVRGACCLRPGVPGLSDNIRVRAIVGRFLEHARVYYFQHAGAEQVFLASADWMTRNLYQRVEILFPIEDKALKQRLKEEALFLYLNDTQQSWALQSDGEYKKVQGQQSISAQDMLLQKYSIQP